MKSVPNNRWVALGLLLTLAALAVPATAQVNLLWYKEIAHDGRIYVFNTPTAYTNFLESREMGASITKLGYGPEGETVVFENETAIDLYNLKHNKDSEVRPYTPPKPPAPVLPTTLKIGDGELKFGLLLQGWYVTDDSDRSTTGTAPSPWLGNTVGLNTFRLRRSEIKLNGKITPSWGFEVMFDPAKTQNTAAGQDGKILQDLAVTFLGLKGHEISLGQKKIVVTEEGVRSSSELDFGERAQVTRGFSDRRETGLFYKGEFNEHVTGYVSITNGTPANTNDDSNDTLFWAGRVDVKPIAGLLAGVSGGTSGGETTQHLSRTRYGAHVRYDGSDDLPIAIRFEYLRAKDGNANGTNLNRDGFYGTVLYTIDKLYQFGIRYDEINRNKDVDGNKTKTFTAGFHYMVKGKNINLKLDYFNIKEEGRRLNNVLDEKYSQFLLAAQVAF